MRSAGRCRHDLFHEVRSDGLGFDEDFSFRKVTRLLDCRHVETKNGNEAERKNEKEKSSLQDIEIVTKV